MTEEKFYALVIRINNYIDLKFEEKTFINIICFLKYVRKRQNTQNQDIDTFLIKHRTTNSLYYRKNQFRDKKHVIDQ